jgi:hypothetical protein
VESVIMLKKCRHQRKKKKSSTISDDDGVLELQFRMTLSMNAAKQKNIAEENG